MRRGVPRGWLGRAASIGGMMAFAMTPLVGCADDPVQVLELRCDAYPVCGTPVVDFGDVDLGDTVRSTVIVLNPTRGHDEAPAESFVARVVASTCPDFSWDSGAWFLAEGATVPIRVYYHPTGLGPHTCQLMIDPPLCSDMTLSGTAVADRGVLMRVCNFGVPTSAVISYDTGGGRDTTILTLPQSYYPTICDFMHVPNGATDVDLRILQGTPPATVFHTTFPTAVDKCYLVTGPNVDELDCAAVGCP